MPIGALFSSGPVISLVSGVHVPTSDMAGCTTIYVMPSIGGSVVGVPNGSGWDDWQAVETPIGLTSGNNPAGTGFDVWVTTVSGVQVAGTAAWSNSGAGSSSRGSGVGSTEIEFWEGHWVNKCQMNIYEGANSYIVLPRSALLVGSFKTTIAGAAEDSKAKRLVSNVYGPARKPLQRGESASTWSYSAAAMRVANGNTLNHVQTFQCLAGRDIQIAAQSLAVNSTGTARIVATGIGQHNTTDIATVGAKGAIENTRFVSITASVAGFCPLGYEEWLWLESGAGADSHTWFGTGAGYKTGLAGLVTI